jgi:hypothetical protein
MSVASLGFSLYRSSKEDRRTERQNASAVAVERIDSTNKDNDPILKFGNYSKIPVAEVHALFDDPKTGKTVNYSIGSLPPCQQIGLIVDRGLTFRSLDFTDPDGHSWSRGKEKPVQSIGSVDTSAATVPRPYDPEVKPSYDLKPLQYCG